MACLFLSQATIAQNNLVTYLGNQGKETLYDVTQISDGSFLFVGYSENLDWISSDVPKIVLSYPGSIPNGQGSNRYGIILHVDASFNEILHCVHFPQGVVEDVRFIKFTNQPYASTGDIFISCNTSDSDANNGGYVLAKLNGNFVDEAPTACEWTRSVWAKGLIKEAHPWDVTSNGEVYYVSGEPHSYDWSAMYCLDETGERKVVEHWRTHWQQQGGEWRGTPASSYDGSSVLAYSGIVMKSWGRCEMRSWTQEEFDAILPDGNGGTKKGSWPADFFYTTPCDVNNVVAESPGYNGYSPEACCPVWGATSLVVDRRNNHVYLGMNFKSYYNFPDGGGTPDFEPAVLAFDDFGTLKWWSRLYHEITPEGEIVGSIPDQYIDALAVDYQNDMIVVGARVHGNNTENFWEGNEIFNNASAHGFQNRFTGTQGDIHISWLGKLKLENGDLMHSTYIAEYSEGTGSFGNAHVNPLLDGWPDPNGGWPNVNTTRMAKNGLKVSSDGSVCVTAVGRRTITTSNAHQKMVKPFYGGMSAWNSFARVYAPDFSVPKYSSLIVGQWDTLTQAGGANTEIYGIWKTAEGVVVVGRQISDNGNAIGEDIPVANVPTWGEPTPLNESAIIAYLKAESLQNPLDGPESVAVIETPRETFIVYPNPTNGEIQFSNTVDHIRVFNSFGSIVKQELKKPMNSFSLVDLPRGVYTIQVHSNNRVITKKILLLTTE